MGGSCIWMNGEPIDLAIRTAYTTSPTDEEGWFRAVLTFRLGGPRDVSFIAKSDPHRTLESTSLRGFGLGKGQPLSPHRKIYPKPESLNPKP